MKTRQKIEPAEVLIWLDRNYPELVPDTEADRNWLWLTTDLRSECKTKGCECETCKAAKARRESLKEFGFRFAFKPHTLPSGATARWAHSCLVPLPFKRGSRKPAVPEPANTTETKQPERVTEFDESEVLAFING